MIDEGNWTKTSKKIDTKGFVEEPLQRAKLIELIEEKDLEEDLFQLCQDTYEHIMEKLKPKRKRRYLTKEK